MLPFSFSLHLFSSRQIHRLKNSTSLRRIHLTVFQKEGFLAGCTNSPFHGTIYNIHTVQALRNLGLPGRACQKLCQKLHSTALTHLHSIVAQRRILEHEESHPHPHTKNWSGPNSHTSYSRKKRKRSPD